MFREISHGEYHRLFDNPVMAQITASHFSMSQLTNRHADIMTSFKNLHSFHMLDIVRSDRYRQCL